MSTRGIRINRDGRTGRRGSPITSLGVVKNDADSVAMTGADPADTMPHVHAIASAGALNRPVADGPHQAITAMERHDLDARLHPGPLLGEYELTAAEVGPRL